MITVTQTDVFMDLSKQYHTLLEHLNEVDPTSMKTLNEAYALHGLMRDILKTMEVYRRVINGIA